MNSDGAVVILSYPDTFVRPAYTEFSSKVWPLFGVGSKDAVQAGHAALLLVKKDTGVINYYDFGRYITTFGYGRVRSKNTDVELEVPIKAHYKANTILNLEEILLWLSKHPEKTHGEGRLVASVHYEISYQKALDYIEGLIQRQEIPYGAFDKKGTNCARFVTDTIIKSTLDRKIKRSLQISNMFTPSPIGNVIKGVTDNNIFSVEEGRVEHYINRSVLKEYASCFFNEYQGALNTIGTEQPNSEQFHPDKGTWLGGIGSGAWFVLNLAEGVNGYSLQRYNQFGEKEFEGVFTLKKGNLDLTKAYCFKHPTNCKIAYLEQNEKQVILERIS